MGEKDAAGADDSPFQSGTRTLQGRRVSRLVSDPDIWVLAAWRDLPAPPLSNPTQVYEEGLGKANSFCALFAGHHFRPLVPIGPTTAISTPHFCGKYSFYMLRWFRPAKQQLSASGSNGG